MKRQTTTLIIFCTLFHCWHVFAQSGKTKILPPSSPTAVQPVIESEDDALRTILKKKKRKKGKRKKRGMFDQPSLDDQLIKESKKPHPMAFHISAIPVVPVLTTNSDRKDYQAEPTTIFHLQFRFNSEPLEKSKNFWMGFRLAPFSGTGVYKGSAGRFGFLYYGPMFGVGSFNPLSKPKPGQEKLPERADGKAIKIEKADYSRSGYFWTSGIAAQWRSSVRDEGAGLPEDDFNNLGTTFDSPGLWSEFHYITSKYDLYSINYLIGVQLGKGKTFVYLGAGVGLWY